MNRLRTLPTVLMGILLLVVAYPASVAPVRACRLMGVVSESWDEVLYQYCRPLYVALEVAPDGVRRGYRVYDDWWERRIGPAGAPPVFDPPGVGRR